MKRSLALKEERWRLLKDTQYILDRADRQRRNPTAAEHEAFNRNLDLLAQMDRDILDAEKAEHAASEATRERQMLIDRPGNIRSTNEYRRAFRSYLRAGGPNPSEFKQFKAALQADSEESGGYAVAPEQMAVRFLQKLDDSVVIRRLATVETLEKGYSFGLPYISENPDDADWTTELSAASKDTAMVFGKRSLTPAPLSKQILLSYKLVRNSPAIEEKVADRLAFKFAVPEEKAFLTGNGMGKPLGVFTASANGISTGRDVSTGNSTTAIGADGLINTFYSLKAQYQLSASWIFHRDAMKAVRLLKDGEGRYLFTPSTAVGEPDLLLGRPVYSSEFAPNTFTTGQYVGIVGDFKSGYQIVDGLMLQIVRLNELYAETNQVGYVARAEVDGMPVLEEAFARVKLA